MIEITATFEDGVFKPHEPLPLLPHSQVRLSVEPLDRIEGVPTKDTAWELVQELWRQGRIDSQGDRMSREELHERR